MHNWQKKIKKKDFKKDYKKIVYSHKFKDRTKLY